MILGRLGLVGFFGILVPGAYFLASILIATIVFLSYLKVIEIGILFRQIDSNTIILSAAFLMLSYLLGVVMRLMGPDYIDRLSTLYFRWVRWAPVNRDNLWMYEVFPYRLSISYAQRMHGLAHIADFFKDHGGSRESVGSDPFFNYCKLLLEGNNSEMTRISTQAESMTRFLSGTAIALAISICTWSILSIVLLVGGSGLAVLSIAAIALGSLLLWPILEGFKSQRRREVHLVLSGTYLVLTGGVPNIGGRSPGDLQASIFGEGGQ